MSMPVLFDQRWSPSDLARLPDYGKRYECIDGALLVTPAPSEVHQRVLASLFARLHSYARGQSGLTLLFSPADITLEVDALTQPDLFAYRTPTGRLAGGWSYIRDLALAVEVLSPGSIRDDRGRKLRYYQRTPVDEYWIVHPDARTSERWTKGANSAEIASGVMPWQPAGANSPLALDLRELFAEAYGEL